MPGSPRQESEAGPSRRRIAIACENCRIRRTKCSGGNPCTACRDNELEASCVVREKARPNRLALSTRRRRPTNSGNRPDDPAGSQSYDGDSPTDQTPRAPRFNAIEDIEGRAKVWCMKNGLPATSLIFQDEERMANLFATPLPHSPADLISFEDELMRHLILSRDATQHGRIGKSQFVTLYNRYRSEPLSMSDDQRAVVYGMLCLAKHDTMKVFVQSGIPTIESQTREDVTYFRMACACLAGVTEPSIYAVLALLCLVPYSQAHGGMGECRSLLRMMAWHVRETGLHRKAYVEQLQPGDIDGSVFPMFRYMDTFMAGLVDLQPFFSNGESDVPLMIPTHIMPSCQQTVSMFSAVFHEDLADPTLDTSSDGYVNLSEASWAPAIVEVRREKAQGQITRVRLAWSEIRYHWLRILLYTARISPDTDPSRSAPAAIIITHSLITLIHIHHEMLSMGTLNPSWPQLRRLSVCCQILVIAVSGGDIMSTLAVELFEKTLQVLEMHRGGWMNAASALQTGLRRAAVALGLALTSVENIPPPPQPEPIKMNDYPNQNQEMLGVFPFDPMSLFGADGSWGDDDIALNELLGLPLDSVPS